MAATSKFFHRIQRQKRNRASNANAVSHCGSQWMGVSVVILTLIPFLQCLFFDFVGLDDEGYVTENTLTMSGITCVSMYRMLFEYHMGNWHPLTMLTYMFEYALFGPMPGAYHFTNVLLHGATTYVLFTWLRNTTNAPIRSFIVALLFGIHPLRAESVAWISERKDVLCGLFWMLSLNAYSRYAFERTRKNYCVVCGYSALCLLSKPMGVTLPCVMFLLDYWPLRRWIPRLPGIFPLAPTSTATQEKLSNPKVSLVELFREKLIPIAMAAVLGIVTIKSQSNAIVTLDEIPLLERCKSPLIGIVLYLDKLLRPIALAPYYPRPADGWSWLFVTFCGMLLLILSGIAVVEMRRRPHLFVGWFWFIGVLFPVSGVLQTGTQLMADRYSYIPSIGLLIAAVWSLPKPESQFSRRCAWTVAIVVFVVLESLTAIQVSYWKGTVPLFEHTLAVTTNNFLAHDMLGTAYLQRGQYGAAKEQFELSLAIDSRNISALNHFALLAEVERDMPLAKDLRLRAYDVDERTPDSGITLARFLDRRGDRDAAIKTLLDVLQKYPRSVQALNDLGFLYEGLKQTEPAFDCYRRAIAIDSYSSTTNMNLGNLIMKQGSRREAVTYFESALRFDPSLYMAHYALARIYFEEGDQVRARQNIRSCLAIAPNFAPAAQFNNALKK